MLVQGFSAFFSGSDSIAFGYVRHEDLSVPHLSGSTGFQDGFDRHLFEVIIDDNGQIPALDVARAVGHASVDVPFFFIAPASRIPVGEEVHPHVVQSLFYIRIL